MTETSKQNGISLEQELDILLPIFILGQSKEWDFLSPEQVKKLVDGERIRWVNNLGLYEIVDLDKLGETKWENPALMVDIFMSTLLNAFEKALIEKLHYCSPEEWESKNEETKWAVDKLVFYMTFVIKLEELPDKMLNAFSGNTKGYKLGSS